MGDRRGPAREALEALWRRHQNPARRLLSPRVLRELELRARFELEVPDVESVVNEVPRGAAPACASCPNRCCGGWDNVVSLRLSDLATLVDLGRTDLVRRRKPRFPESVLEARPGLRALETSLLWRSLPVMRQLGPGGVCAALGDDGRCTLYPSWPASCARFPYTFDPARRRVTWGTRCPVQKAERDEAHARALFEASLAAYEEKVRDAVLLVHARPELDAIGLGPWLCRPGEDPFESSARPDASPSR